MFINDSKIDLSMKSHFKVTTILLITLILVFMSSGFVMATNSNNNSNHKPNCTNLYWLDNTHQEKCEQRRFCDAYMYQGLMTFEKLSDCKTALLNLTNSTNNKKENYGQCVSRVTKLKGTCEKQAETQLKECKLAIKNNSISSQLSNKSIHKTLNKTQIKDLKNQIELLNKQCSNAHKNSTEVCKSKFKELKEVCEPLRCNKNQIFVNNKCVEIQKQCNLNSTAYNYQLNNIALCQNSNLNCSKDQKPFYDECGCGCKSTKTRKNEIEKNYCTTEQKNATVCPAYYSKTCGWSDSTIQCLKYPCATEFTNPCEACKGNNSTIEFWTLGSCPK